MFSRRNQSSGAFKKRFRTDMLIDEQQAFLRQIEAELRLRKLAHKIVAPTDQEGLFAYLFTSDQVDFTPASNNLHNFDVYKEEESLDLKLQSSSGLVQIYKRNLIRCHVISKFNIELEYGRQLLDIAMRNQHNLEEIRRRVDWLEKEIEKILLTNKNIQLPMQKKILNDPTLYVKKHVRQLPEIVIEAGTEPGSQVDESERNESAMTSNKRLEVEMSAWARKLEHRSNGSTNSLLESEGSPGESKAASPIQEETEPELVALMNKKDLHVLKKHLDEDVADEETTLDYHKVQDYIEKNSTINEAPGYGSTTPGSALLMIENTRLERPETADDYKISFKKKPADENSTPFYLLPHNRYTNPEFSRSLVAKDPSSYHRLGIAVTDSYLVNDCKVDGRVPGLSVKEKMEPNDVEIVGLARRMEDLYKNIYKTTTQKNQFRTRPKSTLTESINLEEQQIQSPRPVEKTKSLPRADKVFVPAPLLFPSTPLPQTKHNRFVEYPRSPQAFTSRSAQQLGIRKLPKRIVNQYSLKEQTKLVLFRPRAAPETPKEFILDEENPEKEALYRAPSSVHWDQVKPISSKLFHSGLKYEKIKSLLSINLKSACFNERRDAIKHLGLLSVGDSAVLFALNKILAGESEHEMHRFEAAKSLVLLGDWNVTVCRYLVQNLNNANRNIVEDLLKVIISSKNVQFVDKREETVQRLVENLVKIVKGRNERFALDACICIGKLGISDCAIAIQRLLHIVEQSGDWQMKSLALEAYVRHFDSKSTPTVEYIVNQVDKCPIWVSRSSALRLLSFVGIGLVSRSGCLERIYELLEAKLSDDPIREVRLEVGKCMRSLQLFDRVFGRVERNLGSHEEEVRAKAVTAIEMLGVNGTKVLSTLIDMLELDNSEHVRSLVMKALFFLAPEHPKVVFAFNNLEKSSKIYQTLVRMKNLNKGHLEKSKTF